MQDAPEIFKLIVKMNYVLRINKDNIRGQDKVQGCKQNDLLIYFCNGWFVFFCHFLLT